MGNPGISSSGPKNKVGVFSAMPVPIPGSKVRSDNQKVKFLTIFGRPKTGIFRRFRGVRAAQTHWIWILWRPGRYENKLKNNILLLIVHSRSDPDVKASENLPPSRGRRQHTGTLTETQPGEPFLGSVGPKNSAQGVSGHAGPDSSFQRQF